MEEEDSPHDESLLVDAAFDAATVAADAGDDCLFVLGS